MDLVKSLMSFLKKSPEETKDTAPEGVCPNCWGTQEYGNVIRDLYDEKQIDVNHHQANHAFIKDFVVTYLDGIKLVKGTSAYECPTCRTKVS